MLKNGGSTKKMNKNNKVKKKSLIKKINCKTKRLMMFNMRRINLYRLDFLFF